MVVAVFCEKKKEVNGTEEKENDDVWIENALSRLKLMYVDPLGTLPPNESADAGPHKRNPEN